jgi:hypothetical protein
MSLYFSQVYDSFSTAMHPPLKYRRAFLSLFRFSVFAAAHLLRQSLQDSSPTHVPANWPRSARIQVGEGPLAAASPQTPWLGGNRLRASIGDLLVI